MSVIDIVHTGDMHGRLSYPKAMKLRELRKNSDLLLDSGDAAACGNVFFHPFGERIHSLMNRAGYDAACIGNREYHILRAGMKCTLRRARFPFVSANFCWSGGRLFEEYEHFIIKETEIFVFGLSNVNVSADMKIARYAAQYQTDPVERAEKIVLEFEQTPAIKNQRMIIALTHLGLEKDKETAARLEGRIDIVLGGHSHDSCYGTVKGTHIVHSGCRCGFATRLSYDTETKKIASLERIAL